MEERVTRPPRRCYLTTFFLGVRDTKIHTRGRDRGPRRYVRELFRQDFVNDFEHVSGEAEIFPTILRKICLLHDRHGAL